MVKIIDLHPHLKAKAGDIGIEVEVEFPAGVVGPMEIGGVWAAKGDQSLINGIEYYTRQPIPCDSKKLSRIEMLTKKVAEFNPVPESPRTSVHVHYNVQQWTPTQVWNAIVAYWMLENILMDYCGSTLRAGNLFCLRLKDAEGILKMCYNDLKGKIPFHSITMNKAKYGGINIASVRQLGTLEFRGMRGTNDPVLIDTWCNMIHDLMTKAKEFDNPAAIMDLYFDTEKDTLLYALLSNTNIRILKSNANYIRLIRENIVRLADLAYFHDDWAKWEASLTAPKANQPGLEGWNAEALFDIEAGEVQLQQAARRVRLNIREGI